MIPWPWKRTPFSRASHATPFAGWNRNGHSPATRMDMQTPRVANQRNLLFICFTVITAALFFAPLKELFLNALDSSTYNYIVLIPPVSGFFLYTQRDEILSDASYAPLYGLPLVAVGTILYFVAARQVAAPGGYDYWSMVTLSAVLVWVGGFIIFYGVRA